MAQARSCDEIREQLSARLDGEAEPGNPAMADSHLAECAGCQAWWHQAQAMARLTRTMAAMPTPPLGDTALRAILTAAPAPRPATLALLRYALMAVGLAQFLLGVAQISTLAATAATHAHAEAIGSVSSGHLWHESAAWNVAIGAALAWLAWRRTRPAGLLPVMTAFVAVLALLTANDALIGRVDGGRVLSHGFVLAGYLLLLIMSLPRFRDQHPPAARRPLPWQSGGGAARGEDGPLAPVLPFPVRAAPTGHATALRRAA